jgi:hypothetical protein
VPVPATLPVPVPVPVPVPFPAPLPVPAPVPVPVPAPLPVPFPVPVDVTVPTPIGIAGGATPTGGTYQVPYGQEVLVSAPVPVPVPAPISVSVPTPIGIAGGPSPLLLSIPSPSASDTPVYVYKCPCDMMGSAPTADCTLLCSSLTDKNGNLMSSDQCISSLPSLGDCSQSPGGSFYTVTTTVISKVSSVISSTLTGTIFDDANGNNVQDKGETSYNNVEVTLVTITGQTIMTTTTDNEGTWTFNIVDIGTYVVKADLPTGVVLTGKDKNQVTVTITSEETTIVFMPTTLIFGNAVGIVWTDSNGNGIIDEVNSLIIETTVTMKDSEGTIVDTAVTDSTGKYSFENVFPGTFTISLDVPTKFEMSITIISQETTTLNIGLTMQTGSVTGKMYDVNGYYTFSGVNVSIVNKNDDYVVSTATDTNGTFLFADLTPGDYIVKPVVPEGFFIDSFSAGEIPTTVVENNVTNVLVTLSPLTGSINGTIFMSTNGLDTFFQNVPVTVVDKNGKEVGGTKTDTTGAFTFNGLTPGEYFVKPVVPEGYAIDMFTAGDIGIPATVVYNTVTDVPVELNPLTGSINGTVFMSTNGLDTFFQNVPVNFVDKIVKVVVCS